MIITIGRGPPSAADRTTFCDVAAHRCYFRFGLNPAAQPLHCYLEGSRSLEEATGAPAFVAVVSDTAQQRG